MEILKRLLLVFLWFPVFFIAFLKWILTGVNMEILINKFENFCLKK